MPRFRGMPGARFFPYCTGLDPEERAQLCRRITAKIAGAPAGRCMRPFMNAGGREYSMELEESLLRLRELLGKWTLKVRISPLKAAEYRKSAGKGKIEYQLAVGFMCVCGRKAERSQEEALGWLRKAAESRGGRMKPMVRHARLMIGDMYHDGNGVRKDGLEALKWYLASAQLFEEDDEWYTRFSMSDKDTGRTFASLERESNIFLRVIAGRRKDALACLMKSAEDGSIAAAKLLAGMFGSGVGTDKDLIRAARWCRTAAEQGDAESQRMLGGMYRIGHGVAKDGAEALKWYRAAAGQGDAQSRVALEELNDLIRKQN